MILMTDKRIFLRYLSCANSFCRYPWCWISSNNNNNNLDRMSFLSRI